MVQKFLDGDVAGSREIQLRALPLIDALFCEVNPIPVKAALNLMGKEVGPLRLPLTEMEPQNQERLAKAMKDFGNQTGFKLRIHEVKKEKDNG